MTAKAEQTSDLHVTWLQFLSLSLCVCTRKRLFNLLKTWQDSHIFSDDLLRLILERIKTAAAEHEGKGNYKHNSQYHRALVALVNNFPTFDFPTCPTCVAHLDHRCV